jgi:hypothetical protein
MMKVARMRRGWRVSLTDNEYILLRETVERGLAAFDGEELEHLPYKLRKVMRSPRWARPLGPLYPDEDRRAA